jgi:2-succinyl-5-enolpyruvyl-6-hydroxy-3-cyclohexene-1-carboxylate synthase
MAGRRREAVQHHDRFRHSAILTPALATHQLIGAFVDELARSGVRDACTSPGSRNTPLLLALAREPRINAHSHIDERCAGFFAVGLAAASGLPVALTCTSGTAAANFAPAVIEADQANLPLIVLTADRPPELRESGAGQTIDQIKLYGSAVRWFFEVGNHEATPERLRWIRTLACRAVAAAAGERPGPVHINWALREPLNPPEPLPPLADGRTDGRPWVSVRRPARVKVDLADHIDGAKRGVIVAGRADEPLAGAAAIAAAAGYPLLADPLSGARRGGAAVAHYDLLLRSEPFTLAHKPEVVIRLGDLPTAKPLRTWLASLTDVQQIAIAPNAGVWQDPAGVVSDALQADLAALSAPAAAPAQWLASWRSSDAQAAAALDRTLGAGTDALSELAVARLLGDVLPPDTTLFVAASMPVREIETTWAPRDAPPRVLANRGANGIDGTVSSAFGVAATGVPTVLLLGDVALAHDIGGLLAASRLNLALTIVLLDNAGGSIFDFVGVPAQPDIYELHIATPTGLDFAKAAALYGLDYVAPTTLPAFQTALDSALAAGGNKGRASLLHIRTARAANLELHQSLWAAVAAALAG